MTDLLLASWTRKVASTGLAREMREDQQVSVRELSAEVGCSPAALSRWERGLRVPRADFAEAWGQALRRLSGLDR